MSKKIYPNFLFVGPGKTGSKWLTKVFHNHPNIFVPKIDMYFFDRDENFSRGIKWYKKFFEKKKASHKAVGELSHDYINSELAAKRIHRYNQKMKIIINLRNPIDLCYSTYLGEKNAGWTTLPFSEELIHNSILLNRGMYSEKINFYYKYFSKDDILVLKYDDLVNDKEKFLETIFKFLEVRNIKELANIPPYNTARLPRLKFLGRFAKKTGMFLRKNNFITLFTLLRNNSLIKKLLYVKNKNSVLSFADKKELSNKFTEDIKKTEQITGLNLKNWYY